MFSVPDVLVVSILALLLFGPDRLPKVMRQAGRFMREVQNTSHSFIAEMERAADAHEPPLPPPLAPRPERSRTLGHPSRLDVEVLAEFGDPLRQRPREPAVEALLLLLGKPPVNHVAGRGEQSAQHADEHDLSRLGAVVVVAPRLLAEGALITVSGIGEPDHGWSGGVVR